MKVTILKEAGYEEALLGLSLSFNRPWSEMVRVSKGLYNKDGGHNKFLRFIQVYADISATRYFWQEFDTYTVGVVRQSESTIHTGLKKVLTKEDFEGDEVEECIIDILNKAIEDRDLLKFKRNLPESFLQRRIVNMNYASIRNIVKQRHQHKLSYEWSLFCKEVYEQIKYKEYMEDLKIYCKKKE